jgi:hypothetical protein
MQYFTDLNLLFLVNNARHWSTNSLTVDWLSWSQEIPGYFFQEDQKILPPISLSVFSSQILVFSKMGL